MSFCRIRSRPDRSWPLIVGAKNGQASIGFYNTTSHPYVTFHYGGGFHDLDSGFSAANGTWYYVVGTYDGVTEKIYVNGALQASGAYTDTITSNGTLNSDIGQNPGNSSWLNAVIDEARFSRASRSADWISAEYTNQNTP